MATIIEELLVTLNIDTEQFRRGSQQAQGDINRTRDAAHSAGNSMASSGNTGAQFFSKMRNEAMMLMGLFTAGMGLQSFVKNTINSAAQATILADRIGLSTDRIKAFEAATERAGGSGQAMNAQLVKISDNAARIRKGESAINVLGTDFARFGGDWQKMLDPESAIAEYARIYQNIIEQGRAKGLSEAQSKGLAAQTLEGMGVSGDILPLLKQGNAEMQKQVDIQQKRIALTDLDAKQAMEVKQAWFDFTQQIESFSQKVTFALLPVIQKASKALSEIKLPSREEIEKRLEEWTRKFTDFYNSNKAIFETIIGLWMDFSKRVKEATKGSIDFTDGLTVLLGVFTGLIGLKVVGWLTGITSALLSIVTAAGSAVTALAPLAAVGAAGAAGAYTGNKIYENLGRESQDFIGKGVASVAAFFGDEDAKKALETNETYTPAADVKMQGGQKQMMLSVYEAFKNQGFSDKQAKALTAEVGRENAYSEKTVFGTHTDAANNATNIGFFSWQGNRAEKLKKRLAEKGLMKGGKMEHSQASLNEMAAFAKEEMASGQYSGLGNFMENKDVNADVAAKQLGKGYIKWAYGQDKLRSGESFDWRSHDARRAGYYNKLSGMLGSQITPEQKATMPPPVVIRKGEKDIYGKVKEPLTQMPQTDSAEPPVIKPQAEPQLPQSAFVSAGMQAANNAQNNNITINVKSTDPKEAAREIKTSLNEHLTTPFISNMAIQ